MALAWLLHKRGVTAPIVGATKVEHLDDALAAESLALALTEAIRLEGDVTVNMAPLAFIDVPCARMILDAARGLNPSTPPRRMILRCRPSLAARFVLLGATDIPAVSLVSADDH